MESKDSFIEIKRVISDKETKKNIGTQPESIRVSMIESFRAWHKGGNDEKIKGDMTILVLKNSDKSAELEFKGKVRTMLIEEHYDNFLDRLSAKIIIRKSMHDAS